MRICILGATGLVGRETIDLCARAWPQATLALYASRDQTTTVAGKEHPVSAAAKLEDASAPKGDVAFVALDDEHSKRYVPRLLDLGYRVIDKSNTYRADPNVPLVSAGVNGDLVTDAVRLVANPNCTTIPLTLALSPLQKRFGVESVSASTYQAISGAGVATLDQFLADQRKAYAEPDRLGVRFDPKAYAGNTFPHNGGTDASGFSSEERKLTFESKKILRLPGLAISAQCCRVPVAVGHYENIWLTLGKKASLEEIASVLGDPAQTPFVRWFAGSTGDGLTALSCVHDRDRALVGRLRADDRDASGRSVCVTVVGDNLRLGAATNAVRVASRWFKAEDGDLNA
ncbi:MAG TPA: aspartate-semialdehyde dehydrogenase [Polyangiaceae bacterium]|jgi:aspartate-semialdehyde dehydrogenase|nr:aspartate-semialdehyde dehydrogenase [Polyangiaceae bacterium]